MDEDTSLVSVQTAGTASPKENPSLAREVLIWGIVGLAFAVTSNAILGLIFSIIALKRCREYVSGGFADATMVNVGKGLATAGKIVSIVSLIVVAVILVFWLLAFFGAIVVAGISIGTSAGSGEIFNDIFCLVPLF